MFGCQRLGRKISLLLEELVHARADVYGLRTVIAALRTEIDKMSQSMQNLVAQVARLEQVVPSVETLVRGLREQLEAARRAPNADQELDKLTESLAAQEVRLAQAVAERTVAADEAPAGEAEGQQDA